MAKLDRVTNVVYNESVSGETGSFTNNVTYTYKNDATYGESGLVETYTSTVGDASTSYTYAYDSNGNITTIDAETWDNSDLCSVKSSPGIFICTPRLKQIIEENGFTGVEFTSDERVFGYN